MKEFRFDYDGQQKFIKKRTKGEAITEFENTFPDKVNGIDYTVIEVTPKQQPAHTKNLNRDDWKGGLDWKPADGKKF